MWPWLCWARDCFLFPVICLRLNSLTPHPPRWRDVAIALIEVGSSRPGSPMILFSMGQWEVCVCVAWGEPPWVCSIGAIAICLVPPHWEDVRLKLFYAWLNSLFHSSASYLLLSLLPPFPSFLLPHGSSNSTILKTSHAAQTEGGIRYAVKRLRFLWAVPQLTRRALYQWSRITPEKRELLS